MREREILVSSVARTTFSVRTDVDLYMRPFFVQRIKNLHCASEADF